MLTLVFFYLILPFLLSALVLRFLRRHSGKALRPEIRELYARRPVDRRHFRALRVDGGWGRPGARLDPLGDFETQQEAVDAAYQGKSGRPGAGASWLVLNDKGEVLQEV